MVMIVVLLPVRGLGPTPGDILVSSIPHGVVDRLYSVKFSSQFAHYRATTENLHCTQVSGDSFPFLVEILRRTEPVATQFHLSRTSSSAAIACVQLTDRYRSTLVLHLL